MSLPRIIPYAPVELSGLESGAAGQVCTLLLVEGDGLAALAENNFYQMVVTAGTSGLLMLLGMAGLALLRCRA